MPSPWARRLLENNDHVATAVADSTLGDRVPQDALIEITGTTTAWGHEIDSPHRGVPFYDAETQSGKCLSCGGAPFHPSIEERFDARGVDKFPAWVEKAGRWS